MIRFFFFTICNVSISSFNNWTSNYIIAASQQTPCIASWNIRLNMSQLRPNRPPVCVCTYVSLGFLYQLQSFQWAYNPDKVDENVDILLTWCSTNWNSFSLFMFGALVQLDWNWVSAEEKQSNFPLWINACWIPSLRCVMERWPMKKHQWPLSTSNPSKCSPALWTFSTSNSQGEPVCVRACAVLGGIRFGWVILMTLIPGPFFVPASGWH